MQSLLGKSFKRYHSSFSNIKIDAPLPIPKIRWFYSTDLPLTKPFDKNYRITKRAETFLPFTANDSKLIENEYCKSKKGQIIVNEDGLFTVDLKNKSLKSTYWSGPTYEIRRGIWFTDDGLPIPDLISEQIEEYYKKYRPDYFLNNKNENNQHKLPGLKIISEREMFLKKFNHEKLWPFKEFNELTDIDKTLYFNSEDECILVNKGQLLPKFFLETFTTNVGKYSNSILGVYVLKRGYNEEENLIDEFKNKISEDPKNDNVNDEKITKIDEIIGSSSKKFQNIMENDFSNDNLEIENSKDREIDHLILCVHGIGQTLSSKYSSINFVHDCNHLRKLIKSQFVKKPNSFVPLAYNNMNDMNDKNDKKFPKNCKVQVLPIIWRYDINFGLNYINQDKDKQGEYRLPTLSDLNVDGVKQIRNLTADVLLDILLFYEPKFKTRILESVIQSSNEIYDKYMENNPNFKGKISLVGHSLGSSIVLDILNNQPDKIPEGIKFDKKKHLKFQVENFFGLGSPNGVFKFIKSENIRSRKSEEYKKFDNEKSDGTCVYPNVNNYYNIFYATDLVAYRVEPLIHPSLKIIKPKTIVVTPEENLITNKIKDISNIATNNFKDNSVFKTFVDNTGWANSKSLSIDNLFTGNETEIKFDKNVTDLVYQLNKNGRVDYVLPQGMFDIDIINAVGSHIQYFDDANVADIILQELWKPARTDGKIVGVLQDSATATATATDSNPNKE